MVVAIGASIEVDGMPRETTQVANTLVELLQQQADRYEDKLAFTFCPNGDEEKSRLTYRDLDVKARAIATNLQRQGAEGQRVLLLCRPGLDSITGFFGCLYAGAVPVPLDEHWASKRVEAIVPDARAGYVLATPESRKKIKNTLDGLVDGDTLRWCGTDAPAGDADAWVPPAIDANTSAMLQYSSGSTRAPRGSLLTHHNLLYNLDTIRQAWMQIDDGRIDDSATGITGVTWLPHHHDMGLIGGVLVPIDAGFTIMIMSPGAFLMRPIRWLQAISRNRAPISAGPDFGYHWCVRRTTPEQRADLDLSNWALAVTGGEPVRASTIEAFTEAFAPVGFRPDAFIPAYGLTEATLALTGVSGAAPLIEHVDRTALAEDRVTSAEPDDPQAMALVGCGPIQGRHDVVIVDPESCRLRGPDQVGEIWISGSSVAQGYWDKPEETRLTFGAFLAEPPPNTTAGPYLRTGDLGFFRSGQLFVTGRCKDLIIIRGNNHYPNDIEDTVQSCHPALLAGRGAAFSVDGPRRETEQLVIVHEVHRHNLDPGELSAAVEAIRTAVRAQHGVDVHAVLLVKPQRIPTTSNAKVQRGQCRQLFLDGAFDPVAQWQAPPPPEPAPTPKPPEATIKLAQLLVKALVRQRRPSDH